MESKKRWLAYFQRPVCAISVKDDAVPALRERGRSLLAVGVTGATGVFAAGEIVNVTTSGGVVIARGKISYGSEDIAKIAGKHGDEMRALYPARKHLEVMHRDEMVVL
ncbi:PUA domain-containing protein [Ereboglobus luteus]|uniref:PUA domain-containing protein n=1 Tax=Ereboglobus luteus TaxID=1796921 RepID=UPI001F47CEA9|nr:PUA domain-containing protein [Ereboglobus luteus]